MCASAQVPRHNLAAPDCISLPPQPIRFSFFVQAVQVVENVFWSLDVLSIATAASCHGSTSI